MKGLLRTLVGAAVVPLLCAAQGLPSFGQGPRTGMGENPGFLLVDAINLPADDTTHSRVDVMYRIDQSFFVPVKNTEPGANTPYLRRGEILIEVVDSTGTSQARNIDRVEIGDDKTERPPLAPRWHQGVVSFQVSPGRYHLRVELSDLESKRTFLNDRLPVVARSFSPSRFAASDPLFVFRGAQGTSSDTLHASNFGGDLLFSSAQDLLFFVSGIDTSQDLLVEHTLSVINRRTEDSTMVERVAPTPRPIRPHMTTTAVLQRGEIMYCARQGGSPGSGFVILPLGTQLLPLRSFRLRVKITQGNNSVTMKKQFETRWPEMPLSLKDVDRALDLLRYIVAESVLDSLKRGSFEERRDHLESFWKVKDQTPTTAYNEVMTEYYRRADHATREFASLKQPDGWRSDRGKAYILYGPPTDIRRSLDPVGGFREIWTYDRLNKKLTFTDQNKTGDYVLISSAPQ